VTGSSPSEGRSHDPAVCRPRLQWSRCSRCNSPPPADWNRLRSPSLLILPLLIAGAKAATLDVHYAPSENLEAIDVELINQAGVSIDMAAYVLSDQAVIERSRTRLIAASRCGYISTQANTPRRRKRLPV
jgi:hypothetical protein